MAIIVQKYGGTSVGSLSRIEAVADKVIKLRQAGHQVVVVLSAMAGETNRLLDLALQIDPLPAPRELDMLLATGEQVSIALLTMALVKRGYSAMSFSGYQAGILTNSRFGHAEIECVDTCRLQQVLEQEQIAVVAGFQGIDQQGNITTLGRGGSDMSAVALAAAIGAAECQIFTDVDGVYSADPQIVNDARKLEQISFATMETMASLGAKVLQWRSVHYAAAKQIPIRVLHHTRVGHGTLITADTSSDHQQCQFAICLKTNINMLAIHQSYWHTQSQSHFDDLGLFYLAVNRIGLPKNSAYVVLAIDAAQLARWQSELKKLKTKYQIECQLPLNLISVVSELNFSKNKLSNIIEECIDAERKVYANSSAQKRFSVILNESNLTNLMQKLHQKLVEDYPF